MRKLILSTICGLISLVVLSQSNCEIEYSKNYKDLAIVNAEKIKCIAKNNEKKSLFFTFAIWCKPCRLHAEGAYNFAKEHNLNFYFVILENDKENNRYIDLAIDYLKKIYNRKNKKYTNIKQIVQKKQRSDTFY